MFKITFYTKEGKFISPPYKIPYDKLHKLDGPAIVCKDGDKEWWVNGNLHRIDGPAIEFNDGDKDWYINGKKLNIKKVEAWIKNNNINLKTKAHQVLFMLMFG